MATQWQKQQLFVFELNQDYIKDFLMPVKRKTYRLHKFCASI